MREVSAIEFDRRFQVGLFDVTRTTDNENFTRTHQSTNNWAGFGNATWRITDQLSLTGGVRVTYEKKEVTQVAYLKKRNVSIFRGPGNTILPSNAVIAAAADWTSWTPQATVDYRLTESALLYASYSKGFRSGGFDGRPITGIGKPNAFAPESANSYEVGAKLDLSDSIPRATSPTTGTSRSPTISSIPSAAFRSASRSTPATRGSRASSSRRPSSRRRDGRSTGR
jgi:outer membrane receptor protein involved in Fe transport